MKVSYNWLQTYFDTKLPSPEEIGEKLMFHSFEIEGIEKVGDDSVIDVDVLPNRAHDCLSHQGIAKELSVLLKIQLKEDILRNKAKEIGSELPKSETLFVEIKNPLLCRRYTGAVIQRVKVGPSPDWLKDALMAIGQKSINNIVDATNYVMFGLGQPLHAFDADKLKQKSGKYKIMIREAEDGEKITVLTGEEYELISSNLLITDANSNNPIGIAGVKGGKIAEIDEKTTNIIIESANFHPVHTRKTSQYLKLRTDSSTRFENELSPEVAYYGLIEVVRLIQELSGGVVEGYVDEYPLRKSIQYKIGVSTDEVNKLLGTDISSSDIEDILSRFEFQYKKVNPIEKVLSLAPTLKGVQYKYGASISYDAPNAFDCSSFVSYVFAQAGIALPRIAIDQYIFGIPIEKRDIIPGDLVFSTNGITNKEHTFTRLIDGVEVVHTGARGESQEFLSGTVIEGGVSHCGIYIGEGMVIHASNIGVTIERIEESDYFNKIVGYRRVAGKEKRYVVTIPFERLDLQAHTSFLVSGNKEDLIEEIVRIYGYENVGEEIPKKNKKVQINKKYYYAEKIRDYLTKEGFTEVYTYSLRDKGELELENPFASNKNFVRSNISDGIRESLLLNEKNISILGLSDIRVFEIENVFTGGIEYTSVCLGVSKRDEESDGQIVKNLFKGLGIDDVGKWDGNTYEFNLDDVLDSLPEPEAYSVRVDVKDFLYKPFSLFPGILRDIAVWVPGDISSNDVLSIITREAGKLLIQSRLFDEYKKDNHVSYAFKLVFQSQEKTLSDEEINEIMERIVKALNIKDGFEVR